MISAEENIARQPHQARSAADDFQVCIHRGTQQIGGTCIELACQGKRILLDLGLPLDAGDTDPISLVPAVPGLNTPDASLLALVLSHGHSDHWGLVPHVSTALPIVTGAATRRILDAASAFVPGAIPIAGGTEDVPDLVDRKTIHLGPFAITPFLGRSLRLRCLRTADRGRWPSPFLLGRHSRAWAKSGSVRAPAVTATSAGSCDADGGLEPWSP